MTGLVQQQAAYPVLCLPFCTTGAHTPQMTVVIEDKDMIRLIVDAPSWSRLPSRGIPRY